MTNKANENQPVVSRWKCKVCGKPLKSGQDIGPTCEEHLGLVGKFYKKMTGEPNPDEFISLVELCDLAQELGKSRYWMVKLTGGDAGVKPPLSPEFAVYELGPRKYCRRAAIASIQEIVQSKKKG